MSENRRGKKRQKKKKPQDENIMSASATHGGLSNCSQTDTTRLALRIANNCSDFNICLQKSQLSCLYPSSNCEATKKIITSLIKEILTHTCYE